MTMLWMHVINIFYLKNFIFISFDAFSLKNTNLPGKPRKNLSRKVFPCFLVEVRVSHAKIIFVIKMCTVKLIRKKVKEKLGA